MHWAVECMHEMQVRVQTAFFPDLISSFLYNNWIEYNIVVYLMYYLCVYVYVCICNWSIVFNQYVFFKCKNSTIVKYYNLKYSIWMFSGMIYWCKSWIFIIITPVFSVTWSFRNHFNMMIWCSRNISYQCWKRLCCLIFLWKKVII